MSCNFCDEPIYIKIIQGTRPLLAPATEAEALRQKIQEMTGERFVIIHNKFCPACGTKLKGGEK